MTQPTVGPISWREWDAAAWGRALLKHYFVGHDARPVSRLAISAEELARVAGASDGPSARDAFLRAVRCSPGAFRRHLSRASLESFAWKRTESPPFLAYLFFTCFAAASIDADTADEGVFRERLRQLLDHEPGTSYALPDLSLLWEVFADWLQEQRNERRPYRVLILPDRGRMNLIGYSVRLAFPRRRDRLRLWEALTEAELEGIPTVPETFEAIGGSRGAFSADFRNVFVRARKALARGDDSPELEALWSAVLETLALGARTARQRGGQYQLFGQEDELGHIDPFVVATAAPHVSKGARFARLDDPFDRFAFLVCATDGSTALIVKLLLLDALEDKVSGIRASPMVRAVRDGVLLFRRVDSAIWELATTRPTEGRMRALIRSDLFSDFLRLLSGSHRIARETRFDGWSEVADFDITELAQPQRSVGSVLVAVRCLQPVEVGSQLHLVGGIRLEEGFLGLQGMLPAVNCRDAEHAAVFRLSEESGEERSSLVATLRPVAKQPGVLAWPEGHGDLEGPHMFAGIRGGEIVAPRHVVFHSRGLSHEYEAPTDPSRWLVEASNSDVAQASDGLNAFLSQVSHERFANSLANEVHEGERVLFGRSVDDHAGHDRFAEAAAAISVARKGISEGDLIELLAATVPEASGLAAWGSIRAWTEAGYFDALTRRQWRGRVYFARRPRLIVISGDAGASTRIVLHGLSPFRLRSVARKILANAGAEALPFASLSTFVPAPPAWRVESIDHAITAAQELGLDVSWLRDPRQLAGRVDEVVVDEASLPPGYELQRTWSWEAGGFRARRAPTTDEVRIEHHVRTNGPDRYVVVDVDGRARSTLSRSWALLDGFRRAGKAAFEAAGVAVIVRRGDDGPHVPLPLARAISLRSGVVGGPVDAAPEGRHYAYAVEGKAEQRWLLAWLTGAEADPDTARRFAWLLSALSPRGDGIPLPGDLRRRLRELPHLPDACAISDRRIPRHLHPHVRRALVLAEA